MKILKSRILLVIITIILTGSISVYAAGRYYANQVDYEPSNPNFNVDNMADALDELYDKAKNYKNLSTPTDVEANYLLNGKKAYKSNGTIVTGSMPIITSENKILASGENYTIPQGYHDGTGTVTAPTGSNIVTGTFNASTASININLGFQPSNVVIRGSKSGYKFEVTEGAIGRSIADSSDWGTMDIRFCTITNTGFTFSPLDSDVIPGCTVHYWAW